MRRRRLGKVTIHSQDRAGFVVNALLIPYLLSAIRMYESGFASKEDIDEGMMKAARTRWARSSSDLIGLDTLLASRSRSTTSSRSLGGPRPAEPDGRGRPARPEVRPRLLRLQLLTVTGPRPRDADGSHAPALIQELMGFDIVEAEEGRTLFQSVPVWR